MDGNPQGDRNTVGCGAGQPEARLGLEAISVDAGQPPAFVEDEWQRALGAFQEQIAEINHHIFDYNLEVPLPRFQRPPVDAEAVIRAVRQG